MTAQRTTPAMSGPLLAVLALLAAAAPLSSDMYLASLPMIATDLDVRASGAQLTLTALLLGIALGQLAFGPLSDRYGRIRPLMVGVAIAVVACIAAALAQDIWFLIGARFVQGFAAAAGIVIGRAIISDLNAGTGAARAFTLLLTISSLAPVLAPLLGSVLLAAGSWRSIFWVSAGIFAVMLGGAQSATAPPRPSTRWG